MKRLLLFIILAVSLAGSISAQNNWYERYRECINDSSLEYTRQVIEQWEQAEPEFPDVYAAWFNYYYKMGWDEVMQMTPIPPEDGIQALEFEDSTGAPVYMYQVQVFNDSLVAIANEKIDRAISLYPDRLDFPFGKLAALFRLEDYDSAMPVLHQVIERSRLNGNRWTWTLNTPVGEDGETMFKSSMQDYFSRLFEAELDDKAMQLVEWLLQYYPDEVMFRSDKASLLAITGNNDQALPLFLSIHKDYPDDNIVTSNIAYIYKTMGDKENALKYYRLLSKCDDEEMEELAREAISELTE
jgi:tetratricopeptide (TPR) repeat protein